jgi:peptidoglycan hydrolase-like protein with peptidoglycan-binding domain
MFAALALSTLALLASGPNDPNAPASGPTTTVPAPPAVDPLFPISNGANGPAVAAIQGRLGITVDCDFGGQTAQAVNAWQTERTDLAETGQIGPADWVGLEVPITWGTDSNGNGSIEPSEVTLVCDGNVELPAAPIDRTGWPTSSVALAATVCEIGVESGDAPVAWYDPADDTVTIDGAWGEDHNTAEAEAVGDMLVCVLGSTGIPQFVVAQLSSTRALDGMQTATWDGVVLDTVNAMWTFHPDNGMNVVVYTG